MAFLRRGVLFSVTAQVIGQGGLSIGRGGSIGSRTVFNIGVDGSVDIEEGVWLSDDIEMETNGFVRIGQGTTIQRRCTINGNVSMGQECLLAPNVFISSGTHPFRLAPELSIRQQERLVAKGHLSSEGLDRPIVIADDCWLGTNVVICPGVTIGKGAVVGANAVVTRDVPPYTVVAGCPAREIGNRLGR